MEEQKEQKREMHVKIHQDVFSSRAKIYDLKQFLDLVEKEYGNSHTLSITLEFDL